MFIFWGGEKGWRRKVEYLQSSALCKKGAPTLAGAKHKRKWKIRTIVCICLEPLNRACSLERRRGKWDGPHTHPNLRDPLLPVSPKMGMEAKDTASMKDVNEEQNYKRE